MIIVLDKTCMHLMQISHGAPISAQSVVARMEESWKTQGFVF